MNDMNVICKVGRGRMTLPELHLEDPDNGYWLAAEGVGPGELVKQLKLVGSPFYHGAQLVSWKLLTMKASLGIYISGATHPQLDSRIDAVLKAFDQRDYSLTTIIEGSVHTWLCYPADRITIDRGGEWDHILRHNVMAELRLSIPRHPIPLAGPL